MPGVGGAGRALLDGCPEGARKASLVWGSRAGTKAPMVEGPGADEIAPVGSPEGEARLVRSTEQRSWAGGMQRGAKLPLPRCAVLHAHILRTVLTVMLLSRGGRLRLALSQENITQPPRMFPEKTAAIGKRFVNERGSAEARFFRNPDALHFANRTNGDVAEPVVGAFGWLCRRKI